MKKILLLLALCGMVVTNEKAAAQDIHFSQFFENAILRNPALTGIFSGDYKAGFNYRTQWSNISVPFVTVLASAESRVLVNKEVGDYLSFGVTATYDRAGSISFNSFQVYPAINYNKSLESKHGAYLSFGFAGGYIQRSVDVSKMTFSSQYGSGGYSPLNASGEQITNTTIQNYDLSAGISLNSSAGENNQVNYYIGAAAYHITKPKHAFDGQEHFIRLNTKWTGNLGVRAAINSQYAITAHFNYTQQAPYEEIIGGAMLSWNSATTFENRFMLHAGLFVRYKDAIIPMMKVEFNQYAVTASYDINTSVLQPATNSAGGFELSLFARGNYKRTQLAGDQLQCPRFEQMMPQGFQ